MSHNQRMNRRHAKKLCTVEEVAQQMLVEDPKLGTGPEVADMIERIYRRELRTARQE